MQRLFVAFNQDGLVVNNDEIYFDIIVELEDDETIADFYAKAFSKMYRYKNIIFVRCIGQTANMTGEEKLGAAFYSKSLSGNVYEKVERTE